MNINNIRDKINKKMLEHGGSNPPAGLYLLDTGTGTGKTRSAVAWASAQAEKYKSGILYVCPYAFLRDQFSQEFPKIEAICLNHYIENLIKGDEPKNKIILIDEVQGAPVQWHQLIIFLLRKLVKYNKCTVLLLTATPIKETKKDEHDLPIVKILPDIKYPEKFKIIDLREEDEYSGIYPIIKNLEAAFLLISFEIKDANAWASMLISEGLDVILIHNNITIEEKKERLSLAKKWLGEGKKFALVATTLMEAGVDISFPIVFRESDGIDRLIQASGRCNRNWEYEHSQFIIYPPDSHWTMAEEAEGLLPNKKSLKIYNKKIKTAFFPKKYKTWEKKLDYISSISKDFEYFNTELSKIPVYNEKDQKIGHVEIKKGSWWDIWAIDDSPEGGPCIHHSYYSEYYGLVR